MQSIQDKALAIRQIVAGLVDDVVETITDSPRGIPAGHLYAALMGLINLDTFNAIMAQAIKSGKVEKRGDVYHAKS